MPEETTTTTTTTPLTFPLSPRADEGLEAYFDRVATREVYRAWLAHMSATAGEEVVIGRSCANGDCPIYHFLRDGCGLPIHKVSLWRIEFAEGGRVVTPDWAIRHISVIDAEGDADHPFWNITAGHALELLDNPPE